MNKCFSLAFVLALICFFSACGGEKKEQVDENDEDSLAVQVEENVSCWTSKDSTIYGRADGFGQSAFTLQTTDGRTLDIALTAEDGRSGLIYGDREDTARYAVTVCDDGESLGMMINLSQVDKFIKGKYTIYNCHLVLNVDNRHDTVTIEQLDDHILVAKGQSGAIYRYEHR